MERLFNKKAKVAITSGGNEPVADSTSGSNISIFTKLQMLLVLITQNLLQRQLCLVQ